MKKVAIPECDHIIGRSDPYDAMIPSSDITVSEIPKAVKLARDGASYYYLSDRNLLHCPPIPISPKRQAAYDTYMASWDALSLHDKLVESCILVNFCSKCGASIAEVIKGMK